MHSNSIKSVVLGLACAVGLVACGAVTTEGMIAASRLDPLNTPPGDLALAVGVPTRVRLTDGDAVLHLSFKGGDASSSVLVEETVPLMLRQIKEGGPSPSSAGEVVYAARLAPEEAARLAQAQRAIKMYRESGLDGQGSLAIALVGGCVSGAPLQTLPFSSWLQTNPADGFVTLTRQQDLFRVLMNEEVSDLRSRLGPCAA